MATYVNDLRLTELATGEGSGTWGTTTNTNLELIGEALGYGTQDCFASDADATTTVADGSTDPARAMYFKVTSSATLTATRTLTIAPNTVSRVMLIENATTGSQSIAISQGTGGNVTISSGQTKMVYLDGAGAGAAVVDALADLELGTITVADLTATTADINGGTIDGATIGGATPAAITGTTLKADTSLELATGATVTDILDEDNMSSDSDTALATQQSIKAYVDSQITDPDLNIATDSGNIAIDLDSETLTVAGGTGLDTSATSNTVTIAIDSTVATLTGTQTLTNKTLTSPDINGGTVDNASLGASTAITSLTVDGSITLDGDLPTGAGNVAVGNLTLSNLDGTSPGACNTAIGAQAAKCLTCGDENTAIGAFTLSATTFNADHNTAVGSFSSVSVSTGCDNVAVGSDSLRSTTTGTKNVAVGRCAMRFNSEGSCNVAVGAEALTCNACTGVGGISADNVAVGYRALYTANSCRNTALGACALYGVTSGEENVAIGYRAGRCITTSTNNVLVGFGALSCTTGLFNTVIGSGALCSACLVSSCNVAIGSVAGLSLLCGDNNIFIGSSAGRTGCSPLAVIAGDNNVVIGNNDHACFVATCAWQTSSDCRDKTDVTPTVYGLDFVRALRPVEYKWDKRHRYEGGIPDGSQKDTKCSIGFLAQEVLTLEKQFAPGRNTIIVSDDDPDHLNLGETRIIPALVRAIQEQQVQIDELKTEIAVLKGQ